MCSFMLMAANIYSCVISSDFDQQIQQNRRRSRWDTFDRCNAVSKT